MKKHHIYSTFILLFVAVLSAGSALSSKQASKPDDADVEAIKETGRRVRQAFLQQDIPEILRYHHPRVEKALAWDNYQIGHADMRSALSKLFETHTVEFFDDQTTQQESLEVFGDTAVAIKHFKLRGTPKTDTADSFVFEGRTMLVFVKYSGSPTGWVTVREMIMVPPQK